MLSLLYIFIFLLKRIKKKYQNGQALSDI